METLTALLLAISPVVVSTITQGIKKIPLVDAIQKPQRATLLQAVVAVLSLGAAIASFASTGTLDESIVATAVSAVFLFLSTSIPYWLAKKKQVQ